MSWATLAFRILCNATSIAVALHFWNTTDRLASAGAPAHAIALLLLTKLEGHTLFLRSQRPLEPDAAVSPRVPVPAAASPAVGRGPHTGCRAPASPRDKTVACAASGQRTPDTRPRHSGGRPPARRCAGDANRPPQ